MFKRDFKFGRLISEKTNDRELENIVRELESTIMK